MRLPVTTLLQSRNFCVLVAALAFLIEVWAVAESVEQSQADTLALTRLSLEDLGKVKVTSVSRKSEPFTTAAGAVYVVGGEDIRRTGVTLLPEALRMVPGLQVARANSRHWAISARGFNDIFANKLLVMMDGRTLYTPFFSGVFWQETDTVLEDIDRIEVVRGPGGAIWGANAVNGVINIITKSAKDTQGTFVNGGGGSEVRGFGEVRHGGRLGTNAYFRVYGKHSHHDEFTLLDGGGGADDDWWLSRGGFRVDWEPSEMNRLTLQGDYYYGEFGGRYFVHAGSSPELVVRTIRTEGEGADLLGRWTRTVSSESDMSVQLYYDRTERGFGVGKEFRETADFDFQHRFPVGERHDLVWGGGYRVSADDLTEGVGFRVRDPDQQFHLFSGFIQDEIELIAEQLHATIGAKLEHNDFTGLEFQPSGRIAWTPGERHTVWGAVSRAVRTPSRSERDVDLFVDPGSQRPAVPFPTLVAIRGNRDFDSEELVAYEVGYRVGLHPRLSIDWTAFYHDYDQLRSVEQLTPELRIRPSVHLFLPATFDNEVEGETYGSEVAATWQPIERWRLRAGYSYLEMELRSRGATRSVTEIIQEGSIPHHQAFIWSDADLGDHVQWGVGLRYVDNLPVQMVSSYLELDTRLAWKPTPNCELAIVGRSLFDPQHREVSPTILTYGRIEVDRAVYATLTLRF